MPITPYHAKCFAYELTRQRQRAIDSNSQLKQDYMLDVETRGSQALPNIDAFAVNGSNNLPNLKKEEDRWKVRLIEEEFMQRMWDVEG